MELGHSRVGSSTLVSVERKYSRPTFQRRLMVRHPAVNRIFEGSIPSAGAAPPLAPARLVRAPRATALEARLVEHPPRKREDPVRFRTWALLSLAEDALHAKETLVRIQLAPPWLTPRGNHLVDKVPNINWKHRHLHSSERHILPSTEDTLHAIDMLVRLQPGTPRPQGRFPRCP